MKPDLHRRYGWKWIASRLHTTAILLFVIFYTLLSASLHAQPFTHVTNALPSLKYSEATWGDYDNDGDLDVLIVGKDEVEDPSSRLYRNDGDGSFALVNAGFFPILGGGVRWGDYDNDGDLDLLLSGTDGATATTRLYRNEGGGTFSDTQTLLFRDHGGKVSWGDYDRDGDLDILRMDTRIFRNDGNGQFTDSLIDLPTFGAAEWFDYDNDGLLDILFYGYGALLPGGDEEAFARIYRNQSGGSFVDSTASLAGAGSAPDIADFDGDGDLDLLFSTVFVSPTNLVSRLFVNEATNGFLASEIALPGTVGGSSDWDDYDNDGYPDFLITGDGSGGAETNVFTRVYRNEAGTNFRLEGIPLPGTLNSFASAAWIDYDRDGDLDIMLLGTENPPLYRNDRNTTNRPPTTPVGLTASTNGNSVTLSWGPATDPDQTTALTYNVRIGTAPGGIDVLSPMADLSTGLLRLPQRGNAGSRLAMTLTNFAIGTYYWSVQSIDSSYAGSVFSPEATFQIRSGPPLIGYPKSALFSISNIILSAYVDARGAETMTFFEYGSKTNYGQTGAALVLPESARGQRVELRLTNAPAGQSTHYRLVASNAFGIVYGDDQVAQTIYFEPVSNGLSWEPWQESTLTLGDYDNDGDLDAFATDHGELFQNLENGMFTNSGVVITGSYGGFVAWGDYDNDDDLDLLIANTGKIYRNNGDGTFSDSMVALAPLSGGAGAWGDYDSDGDLDVILAGLAGNPPTSASLIYRNDGGGRFIDIQATLPGISEARLGGQGTATWADFDNDRDLDLLLAGRGIARVYLNSNGSFVDADSRLVDVETGAATVGDYDGDGDLDIALTGLQTGFSVTRIYRNDGGANFVDIQASIIGAHLGVPLWGDYDIDGDLDLMIATQNIEQAIRLYRNDGRDRFVPVMKENPAPTMGAWADYDNDGDLDLFLGGSVVYRNLSSAPNTLPSAPTQLATVITSNTVLLGWQASLDANQPAGLTYNVRVGTAAGKSDVLNPMSSASTGIRRLSAIGNASANLGWQLRNLKPGTYYWSVQAIDNSLAGSAFAPEATFVISSTASDTVITRYRLLPGGQFEFVFTGVAGREYAIEISADLLTWTSIATNSVNASEGTFVDSAPTSLRFYRTRQLP